MRAAMRSMRFHRLVGPSRSRAAIRQNPMPLPRQPYGRIIAGARCHPLSRHFPSPPCYDEILRIGIHTTSQGTLEKTALKAHELGANTFQIFSASPRMWRASMPAASDCQLLARARQKLDLAPLVIHDNYLINLASIDPTIRSK